MAKCIYCGKDVGFLRNKHDECKRKNRQIVRKISQLVQEALAGDYDIPTLKDDIDEFTQSGFVHPPDIRQLIIEKWEDAVHTYLNDGVLDKLEDEKLIEIQNEFHLSQEELDRNGAYLLAGKASILRDVLNGEYPRREVGVSGPYVPNLQKNERILWVFADSKLFEDKVYRKQVGATKGMSIRIMKGVYYRFGAFEGKTVEESKLELFDQGAATVTNKHIYFIGPNQSKRIRHSRVLSYQPFDDGVGITLDTANSKQYVLKTKDGWFTYNLLMNINNL